MRYALILLSCALVISGETLCQGETPPAAVQAQPPKQSFWKRLFHRSGGKEEAVKMDAEDGEIDRRLYNPYPKNPVVAAETSYVDPAWQAPYPPSTKPQTMSHSFYGWHKVGDFFRTMGSWMTFGSRPAKQDEVASVHLAFLGVRKWDDLKKDLETKFTLTPEKALGAVVPIVGAASSSLVDMDNASLRASGPTVPNAPNIANAPSTPTPILPSDLTSAVSPISGVTARSNTLGMDPFLQYRTAQSLLQNVTLLNNTIASAPLHDDYDPYVVSLQVTLMPHKRDGAYDVYTDITFVDSADHYESKTGQHAAATSGKACPLPENPASLVSKYTDKVPRVIPLLVTDDLEAVSGSRGTRRIMELNAALAAAAPQVSGAGTYQKYTDAINKFMGEETNALVTVARLQENVFRVRFGANVQDNKHHLGMVPQAHTVHLLLLYPKDAATEQASHAKAATAKKASYYSCSAIAITHMREATTGRLLRTPRSWDIGRSFYDAVKPFVDTGIFTSDIYRADNLLELSNYVRLNEYKNFQAKAQTLLRPEITWTMAQRFLAEDVCYNYRLPKDYRMQNDALVMSLWSSLSQIFGQSVYSTDNLVFEPVKEAEKAPDPSFSAADSPAPQVLLLDDGSRMSGTLEGVKNVTTANLSKIKVSLSFTSNTKPQDLHVKSIHLADTDSLQVDFESFQKYGLKPDANSLKLNFQPTKDTAKTTIDASILDATPGPKPPTTPKPPTIKLQAQLKSSSQTITKKADGTGTYTFSVQVAKEGKLNPAKPDVKPAYKNFIVSVKGAGLSKQPADGILVGDLIDPGTPFAITPTGDGMFKVNADTLVTLQLQNFNADNKVTIDLGPGDFFDNLNQPGGSTAPLEVQVVTPTAAK